MMTSADDNQRSPAQYDARMDDPFAHNPAVDYDATLTNFDLYDRDPPTPPTCYDTFCYGKRRKYTCCGFFTCFLLTLLVILAIVSVQSSITLPPEYGPLQCFTVEVHEKVNETECKSTAAQNTIDRINTSMNAVKVNDRPILLKECSVVFSESQCNVTIFGQLNANQTTYTLPSAFAALNQGKPSDWASFTVTAVICSTCNDTTTKSPTTTTLPVTTTTVLPTTNNSTTSPVTTPTPASSSSGTTSTPTTTKSTSSPPTASQSSTTPHGQGRKS